MSLFSEPKFFKDRARKIFAPFKIPKIEGSQEEFIYAGIQVTSGGFLATYTNGDPTYRILPMMFSAIAVGGLYNALKTMRKKPNRFSDFKVAKKFSLLDLASGAVTYATGVYAFSEGLKDNDKMWIPCLALAASGYYFSASSIKSIDILFYQRPFLKSCQFMSEPALVACAATYLFYFRHHEEGWLKCLPFLVTAASGMKLLGRGLVKDGSFHRTLLQLKVVEMFLGGSVLAISCSVLAIYSIANDFFWPLTAFMTVFSLYGVIIVFGSLLCFRLYLDMERRMYFSTIGMIVGPITFSSAFLMAEYFEENDLMYPAFLLLTGIGPSILCVSAYQLYKRVPRPVFYGYCQRVFGPVLAVYSSVVTGYVIYRMGWRFSLLSMPFIPAGIYATYRGYRKARRTARP